jgi:hypothetical protein
VQRAGNAAWIPRKGRERLDKIPFYEMFDLCKDGGTLEEILRDATVCSCAVEKAKMQMRATIQFEKPVPPVYISMMEEEIRSYFELNAVRILPIYPKSMVTPEEKARVKVKKSTAILGKSLKNPSITPMDTITLDMGKATVGERSSTSRAGRSPRQRPGCSALI